MSISGLDGLVERIKSWGPFHQGPVFFIPCQLTLNLNWDSVLYLAGKSTKQFLSELLICQVMTTCEKTEGSTRQPGKPRICKLTEFKTNGKIYNRPPALGVKGIIK